MLERVGWVGWLMEAEDRKRGWMGRRGRDGGRGQGKIPIFLLPTDPHQVQGGSAISVLRGLHDGSHTTIDFRKRAHFPASFSTPLKVLTTLLVISVRLCRRTRRNPSIQFSPSTTPPKSLSNLTAENKNLVFIESRLCYLIFQCVCAHGFPQIQPSAFDL